MTAHYTPENGSSRVERRRRAGVRAAWIWGGVLLAGLLIYLAVFGSGRHFQHLRWSKASNTALRNNNAEEAAVLLTACRREVPALAKQPRFVIWQNRLLEIQQRNAARHLAFERKITAIKKLIDSQDGETAALETMLLDAARDASTPEEIAQIRELQTLCESLARAQMLEAARGGVRELQILSRNLATLAELRQKNNFVEYNKLMRKSSAQVKNLSTRYQAVPEVTAQIRKLRGQLDLEYTAGNKAERNFIARKEAFKKLLNGIFAEEIIRLGNNFLQKYPDGDHAGEVRDLMQEMTLLQKSYAAVLQEQLDNMQSRADKSLQALQNSWQKLMAAVLQENRHELALYHTGRTDRRSPDHLLRFETWETPEWSAPDNNGMRHLSFTDLSQRKISVSLDGEGKGILTLPEGRFICRLAWGKAEKKLPQAYWQTMLYDLSTIIQQTRIEAMPEVLLELKLLISQVRFKLPEDLVIRLIDLLNDSAKVLTQTPQEFIFQRKVLTFLQKNTPRFAGLVRLNKQSRVEFYPVSGLSGSDTLWCLDAQDGASPFKTLGAMKHNSIKVQTPSLLKDGKIHAAAIPADPNYSHKMAVFRKEAASQKLKFPELPDWAKE